MKRAIELSKRIKQLRSRLFFKMFLIYAAIIVSVMTLLVGFILTEVTHSLLEQAIDDHRQIVTTLSNYFAKQNANFKQIQRSLYLRKWGENGDLSDAVGEAFAAQVNEHSIEATREISDFLYAYALPMDSDIHNLLLADADLTRCVNVSFRGSFGSQEILKQIRPSVRSDDAQAVNSRRTKYLPAFVLPGGVRAYCIYDSLRDPSDPGRVVGQLTAVYSPTMLHNAYRSYEGRLMGELYLLTDEFELIYDSTQSYGDFPYVDRIGTGASYVDAGSKVFVVERNQLYGFQTVGVIDKNKIRANALPLVRLILIGTFLSILLILPLSYLNMHSLKRRVLEIRKVLNRIQGGDFTAKVAVKHTGDEIDEIALDVNRMSEKLQDTIQKEYTLRLNRANAELKQRTAELYALQSQIDPHFLYNTLEAIRMRAVGEGDLATGEMIKLLARIFRRKVSGEIVVTLREELNNCRDYLELYDMRYEGRLSVRFEAEPDVLDCGIPHHLLQPIVENAVVHGIDFQTGDNEICVTAQSVDGRLVVSICDNGQGIGPEKLAAIRRSLGQNAEDRGESIGLDNVNSRIRLLYGEDCSLEIESAEGEGTRVRLTVPMVSKEALKQRV